MERVSGGPADARTQSLRGARRKNYFAGILLLLVVVGLWVSSSFIMNSMFTDQDYNKPWFTTYLCTSTFTLYLIRPVAAELRARWRSGRLSRPDGLKRHDEDSRGSYLVVPDGDEGEGPRSPSLDRHSPASSSRPLTTRETAHLALWFCLIWFGANWTVNAGLAFTSVSSATILSSMSGFFTLGIGSLVGVEKFNVGKLLAVVCSVLGVILVSKGDHDITPSSFEDPTPPSYTPSQPLFGDFLALVSAVCYACYVILMKFRVGDESRMSMTLFFGFVGLFNVVGMWPIGVILNLTGWEKFELPRGGRLWAFVLINASITFVSDVLYMLAMLKTSPLAVTLGLSLTIPVAVVGDLFKGTELGGPSALIGAALVLGSFVAIGWSDNAAAKAEDGRSADSPEV